jgi:hypothetical protein
MRSVFSLAQIYALSCACTYTGFDPEKTYGDLKGLILLLFLLFGELLMKVVFLCFLYIDLWYILYIYIQKDSIGETFKEEAQRGAACLRIIHSVGMTFEFADKSREQFRPTRYKI